MKEGQTIGEHYWLRSTEALKLKLKSSKAHCAVRQFLITLNMKTRFKSFERLYSISLKMKYKNKFIRLDVVSINSELIKDGPLAWVQCERVVTENSTFYIVVGNSADLSPR